MARAFFPPTPDDREFDDENFDPTGQGHATGDRTIDGLYAEDFYSEDFRGPRIGGGPRSDPSWLQKEKDNGKEASEREEENETGNPAELEMSVRGAEQRAP